MAPLQSNLLAPPDKIHGGREASQVSPEWARQSSSGSESASWRCRSCPWQIFMTMALDSWSCKLKARNTVSHEAWTPPRAPLPLCPGFLCSRVQGLASDVSFQAPGSRRARGPPDSGVGAGVSWPGWHAPFHRPFRCYGISLEPYPALHHQIPKLELPQAWPEKHTGEFLAGRTELIPVCHPGTRTPTPRVIPAFLLAQHHCFRIPGVGWGGAVAFSSAKPRSCFCSECFLQGTCMPTRCSSLPQP